MSGILFGGEMDKQCSKCKEIKNINEYHKDVTHRDGYHSVCKKCRGVYNKQYVSKNYDKVLAVKRKWFFENRDHAKRYKKQWRIDHPENCHKQWLKAAYGMTKETYNEMLSIQGGVCAICGGDNNGRRLNVDHVHDETKRIRGLLCSDCNVSLGKLKEDISIFEMAIKYLRGER